ncbi:MAG: hypothetical protein QNI84_14625 [Henriciella sp.]|nr:hypothetical protein [Henriciella sp.]
MKRLIAFAILLTACGVTDSNVNETGPEIRPQDFVLRPCGKRVLEAPCALAIAGGKRVLFGAPAGVGQALATDDLVQLDVVMLLSLRSVDIEGLDEVRNVSWHAGRQSPLPVVGPDGTGAMVHALNAAFEQADALRIVDEGIPPGGYDAAILVSRDLGFLPDAQTGFDTGDLTVIGQVSHDGYVDYTMTYEVELGLARCGLWFPQAESPSPPIDAEPKTCSSVDQAWPLSDQVVLFQPAER